MPRGQVDPHTLPRVRRRLEAWRRELREGKHGWIPREDVRRTIAELEAEEAELAAVGRAG